MSDLTGRVEVLNAGALASLVGSGLAPALQRERRLAVSNESGGSIVLANAIRDGTKRPDLYLSADAQANELLLGPANGHLVQWFVVFARNVVVLVYSPKSRFAGDFARAAAGTIPWYEVLLQPGVRLTRGDPNLDPLAYYTLFVVELAQLHYGIPDLRQRLLGSDTNPEQLNRVSLGGLQTGEVDATFMYRSTALERGLPYVPLPDEINLGRPELTATYRHAAFTNALGQTLYGTPISFSATIPSTATHPDQAVDCLDYLLAPAGQALIHAYHFVPQEPLVGGDRAAIPNRLRHRIKGSYPS